METSQPKLEMELPFMIVDLFILWKEIGFVSIIISACCADMRQMHRCKRMHRLLIGLGSYVASHCLAVAPQSGGKQSFYCTVYYITLNSNYEAQRASKNLEKM